MTQEELDFIGELSDKADNFIHGAKLYVDAETHKKCLVFGLEEIRDKLREFYIKSTGENPWL